MLSYDNLCLVTTPTLALSLRNLRAEVDERWPHRSRASDGWIGDPAHAMRSSDHNPDAQGIVRALDITMDGVNLPVLVVALTHHPATYYVIAKGLIWSRTHRWLARTYNGSDPHRTHVHVSILSTVHAATTQAPWWLVEPRSR